MKLKALTCQRSFTNTVYYDSPEMQSTFAFTLQTGEHKNNRTTVIRIVQPCSPIFQSFTEKLFFRNPFPVSISLRKTVQ
jgi:hypothetical protein